MIKNENCQNCKKLANEIKNKIKKTDFKEIVSNIQSIGQRVFDLTKNQQRSS